MKSDHAKLALFAVGSVFAVVNSTVVANDLPSKISKTPDDVIFLEQGWDAEQRAAFYQTTQGSRMLPYDWFLNLEQAKGRQKLSAASNLRKMGFLVDERSDTNPDKLPVGFAKDVDPVKGDSIGLTCAACHTGQLKYNGSTVRIDGGQSLIDLEQLQNAILASLEATLADEQKFDRFSKKIIGKFASDAQRNDLMAKVIHYRDWWKARIERSKGITPHGPSRTDAFTIIANEVACYSLAIPENCAPAVAPTQFPFLWNTPDFDWVQYNSSVHSPLGRNVGEVTGVFAETEIRSDGSVGSSANINNLYDLEALLKKLHAPAWPEKIFGKIDTGLASQGEAIFADKCLSCHTEDPQPRTAPNKYGETFAKVNFETPLSVLQTDSTAALAFATRRALPGAFLPITNALGIVGADNKVPVASLLNISGSAIIKAFFTNGDLSRSPLEYLGYRESLSPTIAQLTTYKARPLNGVAFTAPYLHNGSVASLYELLLPAAERLAKFYVGSKQFDPVYLGFSTEREDHSVLLDTAALGNGNSGHEFGTDLSHDERMAVIEYIKTLQ
ncbi:di-heme-cytochrome C peroxidase [Methylomicrobium lacus]|uniref:di-heme-cytochrome C peroxidase n=1 Tax=Methylomicrobium lacus TaxID=136992 RepID=UPI0035A8B7FB